MAAAALLLFTKGAFNDKPAFERDLYSFFLQYITLYKSAYFVSLMKNLTIFSKVLYNDYSLTFYLNSQIL